MEFILKEKIRIGISACTFGAKTRWNYRGWDYVSDLGRQGHDYTWVPVCPEVMAGLGVPRDPVRLVSGNGEDFWQGKAKVKNRKGMDVSFQLKEACQEALSIMERSKLDAFIFMEGSPTCGVYRTTLKERRLGKPPGVFGSLLLKEDLFLVPALDMQSPWKWWDWSRRLHAFVWLKHKEIKTKKDLYDVWHMLKFLCQEVDMPSARQLGADIADLPKSIDQTHIEEWRSKTLRFLRQPTTLKRIQGNLQKHYKHYRKVCGLKPKDLDVPGAETGKQKFVDELKRAERRMAESGYSFAGNPVLYRPNR